ncbi:SDR family NAD(P)-dependent oxidoreductase [Streptomyces sp. NRRL F-5126]|uniref:SDR family NAD(P)-dependent oxidoreductase n=1 Tax=Streptomyces sp. NRRL F-5126 TaxID=1463857 RepID=UPI00068AFA52|nr:SDR family NAD(P)-dependent oxidoreductase [Streptomyces sp. NRRL F-5126]
MTSPSPDSVALVTGGTRGIGKAVAMGLASRGAHVLVADSDRTAGRRVVDEIQVEGGTAQHVPCDLVDANSARALAHDAVQLGGTLDILVSTTCATPSGSAGETPEDVYDRLFGIDVRCLYFLVGALAPTMARVGRGAIVNTLCTEVGHLPGAALYRSARAAVEQLTTSWASEYGPHGIRVGGVCLESRARIAGRSTAEPADCELIRRVVTEDEAVSAVAVLAGIPAA